MSLAKPTNVLIDETLAELANRTGMNASAPESVTRALVEGPVTRLSELWSNFTDRELQMQLSTASGQGLDQLGQLVGWCWEIESIYRSLINLRNEVLP